MTLIRLQELMTLIRLQELMTLTARAQKKWHQLDADQSGSLEGEEILALAEWVWESFRPGQEIDEEEKAAEAKKIMARCDANGDGHLDKDEFQAYYDQISKAMFRFHKSHPKGKLLGKKASRPARTKQSEVALPLVVVNVRKVPSDPMELAEYNEAQIAASEFLMQLSPGCQAAFQSTDKSDPTLVHDVQWFSDLQAFFAHADTDWDVSKATIGNWIPKYDHSVPFKGHVFGAWNDDVKKMTVDVGGADFTMVPRSAGFIKQSAEGVEGKPVIVYNHRRVLPGRMEPMLAANQAFADAVYDVPGVVAITAGIDPEDPLLVHDLQVFANMEVFVKHADMEDPKIKSVFMDWINFSNYDKSFPFVGEVWAAAEHCATIATMTSQLGGANFSIYPLEEVQGMQPNFNRSYNEPSEDAPAAPEEEEESGAEMFKKYAQTAKSRGRAPLPASKE